MSCYNLYIYFLTIQRYYTVMVANVQYVKASMQKEPHNRMQNMFSCD